MGPLSSPDGAVLEIIGNRKELKHSIGGELHGASTKSGDFDNITGLSRGKRCVDSKTWRCRVYGPCRASGPAANRSGKATGRK